LSFVHEMTRMRAPERGVEEWSCTQCARRLLLRRMPEFDKVVLERGDRSAAHVGGTGGMRITELSALPAVTGDLAAAERNWLAAHGIDWRTEEEAP
jgi:hypothetical protein